MQSAVVINTFLYMDGVTPAQLILIYGGTPALMAPYFPTWRNSVVVPLPAPVILTDLAIADANLAEFELRFQSALSFVTNNPDPLAPPDYDARKARHCEGRKVISSAPRTKSNYISRLRYLSAAQVAWE